MFEINLIFKNMKKIFYAPTLILLCFLTACSSSDSDDNSVPEEPVVPKTVFEKLQGNTYKQIEEPDDCFFCQDEINYYSFSSEGLTINGTELNGTCNDYSFNKIGSCSDCAAIVENTVDKLVVTPPGSSVNQTITFLSETQIQISYPVPIFGATWTADLFTGDVPDCE